MNSTRPLAAEVPDAVRVAPVDAGSAQIPNVTAAGTLRLIWQVYECAEQIIRSTTSVSTGAQAAQSSTMTLMELTMESEANEPEEGATSSTTQPAQGAIDAWRRIADEAKLTSGFLALETSMKSPLQRMFRIAESPATIDIEEFREAEIAALNCLRDAQDSGHLLEIAIPGSTNQEHSSQATEAMHCREGAERQALGEPLVGPATEEPVYGSTSAGATVVRVQNDRPVGAQDSSATPGTATRSVAKLRPHPLNQSIYADEADEALVESVRVHGILTSLIVTTDDRVVSGHRRLDAAKKLGIEEVPVSVLAIEDEDELARLLITANEQRQRTVEQRIREYAHLKELEERRAKQRQCDAGARGTEGGRGRRKDETLRSNLPEGFGGRARDIAAKHVKLSAKTLEKGLKVVQRADELRKRNEVERADELIDKLNGGSVHAAFRALDGAVSEQGKGSARGAAGSWDGVPADQALTRIIDVIKSARSAYGVRQDDQGDDALVSALDAALGLLEAEAHRRVEASKVAVSEPQEPTERDGRVSNMYAGAETWNPFRGCGFACSYCKPSFQGQAKRQKHRCEVCYRFEPHVHANRISVGKVPKSPIVFVCGNGDIAFCNKNALPRILDVVDRHGEQNPNTTYYLQSKEPSCFEPIIDRLSSQVVLVTTLETNRDDGYDKISKAPPPTERHRQFLALDYPRKVVTVEPVLDFDADVFAGMIEELAPEYVWLGFNSRPKSVQLPEPSADKLRAFTRLLSEAGIPIRAKELRGLDLGIETT